MRKTLLVSAVLALIAGVAYLERTAPPQATPPVAESANSSVEAAFRSHANDIEVQGAGVVTAVLPEDDQGSRHQRFLVRLDSGVTVLISHNIDLARPVSPLRKGDTIAFRGEYVWNPKGGLVHWTHRDPAGRHKAGWLKHDGETFQ